MYVSMCVYFFNWNNLQIRIHYIVRFKCFYRLWEKLFTTQITYSKKIQRDLQKNENKGYLMFYHGEIYR